MDTCARKRFYQLQIQNMPEQDVLIYWQREQVIRPTKLLLFPIPLQQNILLNWLKGEQPSLRPIRELILLDDGYWDSERIF